MPTDESLTALQNHVHLPEITFRMDNLIGLAFCLLPIIAICALAWAIFQSYPPSEGKKIAIWQKLATANRLTFIPGSSHEADTFVTGEYRQRFFILRTLKRNSGQTYTLISLSNKDKAGQPGHVKNPNSLLSLTKFRTVKGRFNAEENGQRVWYEQPGIEEDIKYLQSMMSLLHDLAETYPKVVALDGEAVSTLQEIAAENQGLKQVAIQLLRDIAQETTTRLASAAPSLLCAHCLVRCTAYQVSLRVGDRLTYYGCRVCRQSQEFIDCQQAVAVLDSQWPERHQLRDNILRVNWLQFGALFDFDSVEIIQTTDEEVERFVVQVGNDTDTIRRPLYRQMNCVLAEDCQLSENTVRILQRMFGQVVIKGNNI